MEMRVANKSLAGPHPGDARREVTPGVPRATTPPVSQVPGREDRPTGDLLRDAVARANAIAEGPKRLSLHIHEGSERVVVRIINLETNEVVREFPPEELLNSLTRLREFVGLLMDELA